MSDSDSLVMSLRVRLNVDMKSNEPMSIGTLAERFGLATHVLRHWESMGLLTPERDTAGRRRYDTDDLTRVATILCAKEAGLSLDTIGSLNAAIGRARRRDILREEAERLRSHIAAAQAALELIEAAANCDYEDYTQCPNYRRRVTDRIGAGS